MEQERNVLGHETSSIEGSKAASCSRGEEKCSGTKRIKRKRDETQLAGDEKKKLTITYSKFSGGHCLLKEYI